MIAATYARKSNRQTDRSRDDTSCARQIERAREVAASKGWTVAKGHIYRATASAVRSSPSAPASV
jgi:polysaccharide deacetylase 2 family uncharacterized protein YibQ